MLKLKGKSILVTGGAGFIGSHLVNRLLLERPAKVVVVDNFFLGRDENLDEARVADPDLKVLRLDASDLAAMRAVVGREKIDVVFNLAVIPLPTSLEYPVWTVETNIRIATTFCEITRWNDVETLIHCSSSEAYGTALYVPMDEEHPQRATTPYAASKAAADQVVLSYWRTFGIAATIVRPFNNYGPRQNPGSYAGVIPVVVQRVARKLPVEIHGDGEQTRDFLFVRDTAEAFVRAYERVDTRGMAVNVATGQETTINELVRKLLKVLGAPDHPTLHTAPRPGDVRRHCGDITLSKKLLDFCPSALREEHLAETVEWYLRRQS